MASVLNWTTTFESCSRAWSFMVQPIWEEFRSSPPQRYLPPTGTVFPVESWGRMVQRLAAVILSGETPPELDAFRVEFPDCPAGLTDEICYGFLPLEAEH